jgi:hypothetical protein
MRGGGVADCRGANTINALRLQLLHFDGQSADALARSGEDGVAKGWNDGRKSRLAETGRLMVGRDKMHVDRRRLIHAQRLSLIKLLGQVESAHPGMRRIHVFLDNATYHRRGIVKERWGGLRMKGEDQLDEGFQGSNHIHAPHEGLQLARRMQQAFSFERVIPKEAADLFHIRVASKPELKERILTAIDDINKRPVVHSWSYKLDQAVAEPAEGRAGECAEPKSP